MKVEQLQSKVGQWLRVQRGNMETTEFMITSWNALDGSSGQATNIVGVLKVTNGAGVALVELSIISAELLELAFTKDATR